MCVTVETSSFGLHYFVLFHVDKKTEKKITFFDLNVLKREQK